MVYPGSNGGSVSKSEPLAMIYRMKSWEDNETEPQAEALCEGARTHAPVRNSI